MKALSRTRATILNLVIIGVLVIGFPVSVHAKTGYEMGETCHKTYYSADRFAQDYSNGFYPSLSIPPSEQARKGEYALRLYRSGKDLDAERRKAIVLEANKAADEAYKAHLDFISNQHSLFASSNSSHFTSRVVSEYILAIEGLQTKIKACDKDNNIPPSITKIAAKDIVDDQECVIRYATMYSSYNQPAQKKYFNDRATLAIKVDKFLMGYETGGEKFVQDALAKGKERAAQNFNPAGAPNYTNIIGALENVKICDVKYGLAITPIPQDLILAASGKSNP